jgi:hypothetical protein
MLSHVIFVPSQGPVRKRERRDLGQRMDFVVDDLAVLTIGKPADILVRDSGNYIFDNFFAFAPHDHVDVRAMLEQVLDFQRCLVASDDRGDFGWQLGNEIADVFKVGFPLYTDTKQIDLIPDEFTECFQVLISRLVPKVEERYFADEIFHTGDYILKAGRRKNRHCRSAASEIRIQS